jgi:hypothetical protein
MLKMLKGSKDKSHAKLCEDFEKETDATYYFF